jgi:iduronate 2-sulfatase
MSYPELSQPSRRLLGAIFTLLLVATSSLAAPQKPNVLLLCVDDLKPLLGCYGDPLAKTPNLDRLAARGMRFDTAFCNQSVCAPSRNNLLLGSRSTSTGIYDLGRHFRDEVPNAVTMPQHFMQHGWSAESIGKILHTGHGNHDDPLSWSSPSVIEKVVEYLDPANSADGQLTREEAYFSNRELGRIGQLPRGAAWENSDVPDNAYADGRIADEGIRRLQKAAGHPNSPFFLALGFVKPHLPLTAPKRFWDMHDPEAFPLASFQQDPAGAPRYAGKRGGEIVNYAPLSVDNLKDPAIQRTLIHAYYACTSFTDSQIGRVLDELDRLKLTDNTIIVVWGDHGWHLGDHGYWTKHTTYEQANRIPLLIIAPGVTKPGSATSQPAETVDIFPTLAELAGLPAPTGPQPIDGLSLVPVLHNPDHRVRDHAYHCYPRGDRLGRAIRTERYRLVEWKKIGEAPATAEFELYDYVTDPLETRNLAAENPDVVQNLRAILARHPEAIRSGTYGK